MSTLGSAVAVAASALSAERTRIEVAVSNLANAESTGNGQPYRRRDVVLAADGGNPFDAALGRASAIGVKVAAITQDAAPARQRFDPSHPDADGEGFVALPNVNAAEEMVDMVSAARAYQANLTAINLIRDLVQRSLELGRS